MRKVITAATAFAIASSAGIALPIVTPAHAQTNFSGCIFEPEYKGAASFTYLCRNSFATRRECEQQLGTYRDVLHPIGPGGAGGGGWGRGGSATDDYVTGMVEVHCEEQDDGDYYLQVRL